MTAVSPDDHGAGLSVGMLDALRYDGQTDDPCEVGGILRSFMPAGVRVLDVGCGTGSITLIANRGKANDVVAIEPDRDRAAAAAARGLAVHCGLMDDSFVAANRDSFDVVMFADVLEHQAAPAQMLGDAAGLLNAGGVVIASVPNVAHWSVRLALLLGRFDYAPVGIMDATHLRWFTARTIRSLFAESGFEVVKMRQTAGTDLPIYHRGLLRLIPGRVRRPIVRTLAASLPRLFGCQHVVVARKRAQTGS